MPEALRRKYRLAAWIYLHVGLLYLAAVWAMAGAESCPRSAARSGSGWPSARGSSPPSSGGSGGGRTVVRQGDLGAPCPPPPGVDRGRVFPGGRCPAPRSLLPDGARRRPPEPRRARPGRVGSVSREGAAVLARGVGYRYPSGRTGLEPLELSVRPGEIVVVLGPNGSGKSTLLRLLATDLRPSTGSLTLLGRPVPREPRPDPAPDRLRSRHSRALRCPHGTRERGALP